MPIVFLIKNANGNIEGEPRILDVTIQPLRDGYKIMPIQIWGIGEATVQFQASQSHEDMDTAIRDGHAIWTDIENGTYTKDTCSSLSIIYPYIKAVITGHVSGNDINVTIGL